MAWVRADQSPSVYVGLWPICLVVYIEAGSGKYDDFTNWDSLTLFCEESGLKWVRAGYLKDLNDKDGTTMFPKEQDIPDEAFTTLQEHKGQIGRFDERSAPLSSLTRGGLLSILIRRGNN